MKRRNIVMAGVLVFSQSLLLISLLVFMPGFFSSSLNAAENAGFCANIVRLFQGGRTLSSLKVNEIAREEIITTRLRARAQQRIQALVEEKKRIFTRGARNKDILLRGAIAQDFELKTQEQVMSIRQVKLRSLELLTLHRLRMIKENQGRGSLQGRFDLGASEMLKLQRVFEGEEISLEKYTTNLDALSDIGSFANSGGEETESPEVSRLMAEWADLDQGTGSTAEVERAFKQVDGKSRERLAEEAR